MLSSTVSKRAPTASRTHSTFLAMASGVRSARSSEIVPSGNAFGRMPTISASRPGHAEPRPVRSRTG
jgi:hypothetical protein